jgi:hypothetical protein
MASMAPRGLLRALILTVVSFTALLVTGAATASAAPKGEFAVFADCPLSNAELSGCIVGKTTSGEIALGKKSVPITNEVVLQGGFIENEAKFTFVGAADGKTLSKSPQKVPGGLAGLVNCPEISNFLERAVCQLIFENGLTGVNATTELAGAVGLNEGALLEERGVALELPVRIKLENPLLGNECFIGSNASPLRVKLTTGTTSPPPPNKAIKGKLGALNTRAEGGILVVTENALVDNAFAAPGASGCGGIFSFLIDPLIDAKLGIPASAGHNTAILNGTLEQTGAEEARNHE